MQKKRYVVIGVGGRSRMYTNAITKSHAQHCELVAICDNNPGRMELLNQQFEEAGLPRVATYSDA
ncbi:MAG TPA: gfo/Idh/MocA family oxidoreductase, partial [Candidatus Brocadiia bacterium]|nr:gfo/Idh/MocA family oxidoreductase [Candidatus Brocadiia bacterium]